MVELKAWVPFQNPQDTLDFFKVYEQPELLIEKELAENFDTFGSYYPLYLQFGSLYLELHHAHEVLIEVLISLIKITQKAQRVMIPYFVQHNIKKPVSFVLEIYPISEQELELKHYVRLQDESWWQKQKLRRRFNRVFKVNRTEFATQWDQFCHTYFFLLLKLYGQRNCIIDHYRFIHTLMLWDSRKTEHPIPYPLAERKYMELYQVVEHYAGKRPKTDEEMHPVLEEITLKLYEDFFVRCQQQVKECGLFLGKPIISKRETFETAVTQYIFLTYPDTPKLVSLLGDSFLKNANPNHPS